MPYREEEAKSIGLGLKNDQEMGIPHGHWCCWGRDEPPAWQGEDAHTAPVEGRKESLREQEVG